MTIKELVNHTIGELKDFDGGVVEFDIALKTVDDRLFVAPQGGEGLSRLKFHLKLRSKRGNKVMFKKLLKKLSEIYESGMMG